MNDLIEYAWRRLLYEGACLDAVIGEPLGGTLYDDLANPNARAAAEYLKENGLLVKLPNGQWKKT